MRRSCQKGIFGKNSGQEEEMKKEDQDGRYVNGSQKGKRRKGGSKGKGRSRRNLDEESDNRERGLEDYRSICQWEYIRETEKIKEINGGRKGGKSNYRWGF